MLKLRRADYNRVSCEAALVSKWDLQTPMTGAHLLQSILSFVALGPVCPCRTPKLPKPRIGRNKGVVRVALGLRAKVPSGSGRGLG